MQETGTLGSLGAEIIIDTSASEIFAVDLTGDFKGRVEMQGSIDGVDFMPIQVKPYGMIASTIYSHIIEGAGAFVGSASGAVQVKAVVTKYVSGSFDVTINAPTISSGGGGSGGSVVVTSSALPTGAARETTLQDINNKTPTLSSGAVPVVGPLTDTQLRASAVPVSGPLTDAQLRAANLAVAPNITRGGGAIDANTQRVTLATDAPGVTSLGTIATNTTSLDSKAPALVGGRVPVDGSGVTQPVSGPLTDAQLRADSVAVKKTADVFTFSTVNSSSVQLAAGATFPGAVESVVDQRAYSVLLASDQPGALTVSQFIDAGGSFQVQTQTFPIAANVGFSRSFAMNGNYVRVSFQNTGASATTTFRLDTAFGDIDPATQLNNGPVSLMEVGGVAFTLGQKAASGSLPVTLATDSPGVLSANVVTKFREAFEASPTGDRWTTAINGGDIIAVDGNAAAASYLVISKDPLSAGVSSLSTVTTFNLPIDLCAGLSLSQRTLGQEFAFELVSTEAPLATPSDLTISSIQQATTTLTVTTATPHGLKVGHRIGIRDCNDSRMNYPALVVATTPSATQFTATAGPGGTIPSVTAGPFTSGFVFFRSALGYAQNGASQIFENATATNASFYVRSEAGDVFPSGTIAGNHAITIATTASVQAINAALNYAFQPTSEFRLTGFVDGLQFSDAPVDTLSAATSRVRRTQVVPDIAASYRLRFRATNNASLTRPVAQIVTVAKTGTTTATVTTDVAHGLTTGDVINAYGVRDQTNFANLTAATTVASVVNATTFTVIWGSAVTATSYGGYVARVNGGNLMSALGALTMSAQSISRTNNVVTVVGSAHWSGALIGDYVNLVGIRDTATGASLGLDGPYRVANIVTTTLTLEPIGDAPTGADVASVNCGGAVIKRTDLRISFVRVLDFERQRVELMPRPTGDASAAAPVTVQNSVTVSGTVTSNIGTGSLAAGTNLIGNVSPEARAGTAGAITATHHVSAATTNATVAKASAGRLMGFCLSNTTAAWVYIAFHNSSTTPTAGTGVVRKFGIAPGATLLIEFMYGISFATGIGFTTVTGSADADATAVTAGALVGEIFTI
jgi:hypothetical protein